MLVVPCIKVSRDNCVFENGGDWADDLRNRPGGGVVVEAGKLDAPACVEVSNSHFQGNYLKDIQLSKGALNCRLIKNRFSNVIKIQPNNRGGHELLENSFTGEAHISTIYGTPMQAPIVVRDNNFETKKYRILYLRKMPRGPYKGQKPRVIVSNNTQVP